ncbi:MAG: type II secretion system major pseudopilin GspG [Pseudomonadota bacterium]
MEHTVQRPPRDRREGGFTLTEIMVVVFIIGLLSSVVLFNVLGAREDAQAKTAKANITRIANALEQYSLDMYDYPTERQGLLALVEEPDDIPSGAFYRNGGYINRLPIDPWGREFAYERPGRRSGSSYDLFSYGADGEEGGEELNADIGNWD